MIPKVIHYCWFGKSEKSKLSKKCIASWIKHMPEYKIIEWNEDNFDINQNSYCQFCYENRKWAYLSDFVRLKVVSEYGGIYFDTDVEVIRRFDELCEYSAFFGFENDKNVNTGLGFGAEAHHPILDAMIEEYVNLEQEPDGAVKLVVCPQVNTKALIPFGLKLNGGRQLLGDVIVLSKECLNPYEDATGILQKSDNTYSIHWYSKSWMSKKVVIKSQLMKPLHRILGVDFFSKYRRK